MFLATYVLAVSISFLCNFSNQIIMQVFDSNIHISSTMEDIEGPHQALLIFLSSFKKGIMRG